MQQQVNIEDVKQKLYERLKPSGWGDKLKTFILSKEFEKILKQLLAEVNDNRRFTPPLKQVFRAFEECPYKELKVVMIGQDPYPYPGVADGIAFSCGNTKRPEASLKYMLKEVNDTIYPQGGYTWDPDLKHWSNQGILIINTAFTTSIGKVGQHYALWQPLIAFLLDILTCYNPGLIYVFMGKKAAEWSDSISDNNWKLFCTHPAFAAHQGAATWDSGDIFNKINDLTDKYYKTKIVW